MELLLTHVDGDVDELLLTHVDGDIDAEVAIVCEELCDVSVEHETV